MSSPLVRARETMELMRATLGLEPAGYRVDARLAEIAFGEWEGLTYEDVLARDQDVVARRESDKWGFLPPGGESYAQLTVRMRAWHETRRPRHGGRRPWRHRARADRASRHRAAGGRHALFHRSGRGLRVRRQRSCRATREKQASVDPAWLAGYHTRNRWNSMSFNTFGHLFRVTTFGESHGPAIGCVVDGCPPRIPLTEADIQPYLDKRRPGQSRFTTQRREPDDGQNPLGRVRRRGDRRAGDDRNADCAGRSTMSTSAPRTIRTSRTSTGPATPTTPTTSSTACATIAAAAASRRARPPCGSPPARSRARSCPA